MGYVYEVYAKQSWIPCLDLGLMTNLYHYIYTNIPKSWKPEIQNAYGSKESQLYQHMPSFRAQHPPEEETLQSSWWSEFIFRRLLRRDSWELEDFICNHYAHISLCEQNLPFFLFPTLAILPYFHLSRFPGLFFWLWALVLFGVGVGVGGVVKVKISFLASCSRPCPSTIFLVGSKSPPFSFRSHLLHC